MPKLSVIIPVYNASEFLRETLNSVLTQSFTDLELICVDDGSTDNSLDILKEYEEKDIRVLVLTQQNQFAGAARNNGLAHASGDYVHFLDADDKVLPYAYEAIMDKAQKYDPDILRFPALSWDAGQKAYISMPRNALNNVKDIEYNRLFSRDETNPIFRNVISVTPWAGICRRAFLLEKNIRFNNLRCVNDRSFFWACVTNTDRAMVCRDRVTFHRMNQSSSLIGNKARHFDCVFRSMEITAEQMRRDNVCAQLQKAVFQSEFLDFSYWYNICMSAAPEDVAEQIHVITETFVSNYTGPYAGLLREKYMDALRRVEQKKRADTVQKSGETVAMLQEACGQPEVPVPMPHKACGLPKISIPMLHEACEQPKVSIIMPVFNAEDHLNEVLDSLQKQKLHDIEFILINNGSTDGSAAILQEYAALDRRIRILDAPDDGCGMAGGTASDISFGGSVNRGIDAARGKYIGILNPDDIPAAEMFRELYQDAVRNRADFILSDYFRFRENKDGIREKQYLRISGPYGESCYRHVLCPGDEPVTFRFDVNLCSGIYNRDFLNRHHIRCGMIPMGGFCRDSLFRFQIFFRAKRAYFEDTAYYMERQKDPGSSVYGRDDIDRLTEEYRMIRKLLEEDSARMERLGCIFHAKKFDDFIYVYRRTARKDQRACLHRIRDEFGELPAEQSEKGLPDQAFLSDTDRMTLGEITSDPDAYFNRIRVSVIMPVYNEEKHLRESIDSLLGFNETTFELICVDDGSTDATPEILYEYEQRDDRVRVILQRNGGAGSARNTGIPYARGEYIAFLDAGNIYEPDMLRCAYEQAHLTGADIVVVGSDKYIEETGEYIAMSDNIRRELLPPGEVFAADEIRQNLFRAFADWPCDKIFRTDYVRENGLRFQELYDANDMLFVFAALAKAQRISVVDPVLVHHRRTERPQSLTREKSRGCFYDALCALRDQLKMWNLYETREQDFINYCLYDCFQNLNSLCGEAYFKLYDRLKFEWLAALGVLIPVKDSGTQKGFSVLISEIAYTARPAAYFYNEAEFAHLAALLSMTPEDYLFRLKDEEKQALQLQLQMLCSMDRQTIRTLEQKNRIVKKKNKHLSEKNGRLRKRNSQLNQEIKQLKAEQQSLKNSSIWKWGRIVTWPFRKIRRLLTGKSYGKV